jgi:hypothetical protein
LRRLSKVNSGHFFLVLNHVCDFFQNGPGLTLRRQVIMPDHLTAATAPDATGGPQNAGEVPIAWDGLDDKGKALPPGAYTVQPVAYDASDKAVAISLNTSGTVSGVSFQGGGPLLRIGTELVKMSDVTSINERNTP